METAQRTRLTTLRPTEPNDIEVFAAWPPYEDPAEDRARLPYRSQSEWQNWYAAAQAQNQRETFTILNAESEVAGLIETDASAGTKRLHLEIGSPHARRGIGTDATIAFLDERFLEEPPEEELACEAPACCQKAVQFASRFSFVVADRCYREVPEGRKVFEIPGMRAHNRFFRIENDRVEVETLLLKMPRLSWVAKRDSLIKTHEKRLAP